MDLNRLPVAIFTQALTAPQVNIFYPKVEGLANSMVQEKINREILQQVYSLIEEQKKYQVPGATEMNGIYELKTNERGVLSLTQRNYAYTYPMAHGMTILKSLTFDVDTGTAYSLKDLFKPNSDYLQRISRIIKEQIKKRNLTLIKEFQSIRPDQDYYIADKALVIYFQLYEITPYYVGFPMFPVSVYDLEDIINEKGPLGIMLANQ